MKYPKIKYKWQKRFAADVGGMETEDLFEQLMDYAEIFERLYGRSRWEYDWLYAQFYDLMGWLPQPKDGE